MMDKWASGGAYDRFMGRWSRLVAAEFIDWLSPARGLRWLDLGCGTGALTQTILSRAAPASVHAIDRSEGYVAHARAAVTDRRAHFVVGDASDPQVDAESYDVAVMGLVLNFLPDPGAAVTRIARTIRKGGTFATYVWDYAGEMQFLRRFWDAAVALDPEAQALDEGRRFPLCRAPALESLFRNAGLGQVAVRAIDVTTRFASFEDFWSPFLTGEAPAPGYAMSLSQERRDALERRLRFDGALDLIARAWAVRGSR